jgi:hypothetical protein
MALQNRSPVVDDIDDTLDFSLFLGSPLWCNVVNRQQRDCRDTMTQERTKSEYAEGGSSVRASISFPPELYRALEDIAKRKKVSLAWVVREAAEKYVADEWPLFIGQK